MEMHICSHFLSTVKLVCEIAISELASFVLCDGRIAFSLWFWGFAFVSFPDQGVFATFIEELNASVHNIEEEL